MNLLELETEISDLFKQKEIFPEQILETIRECNEAISIELYEKIKNNFIIHYINDSLSLDEDARITQLKESINNFQGAFDDYLEQYGSVMPFKELNHLKLNVIGSLEFEIKLLEGFEKKKSHHPIQITCDAVVLLALFEELEKEMFTETKQFERRISHLVSENFISKNRTLIPLEYGYKKMKEGGIVEHTRNNLKEILVKILKKLN